VPVVASSHPLARAAAPIRRETLEPHVQLVLTGRTPFAQTLRGGIVSHHLWRFADLTTRLEFLLAGFGWCNMPRHMIEAHVKAGRLKRLVLADEAAPVFRLYVASARGRELGRAGKWLVADLRERLKTCPGALQTGDPRQGEPMAERLASETSGAGGSVARKRDEMPQAG
jgi:DNA-binding transcriptional LysR family regulator